MGYGCGDAPEAPNYQPMADASTRSAEIMAEIATNDRNWSQDQFFETKALMQPVIDDQLTDSAFQRDFARTTADRGYETTLTYLDLLENFNADQTDIARGSLDLSREQIGLSRELGTGQLDLQQQGVDLSRRGMDVYEQTSGVQMDQMRENLRQGKDYYDNYINTFRPVEQRVVDDAMAFNTAARQDELARDYQAQHARGLAQQRASTERAQASRGVNPNSAAALAMDKQSDVAAAASSAAGMSATRQAARAEGQGRLMDAVGIGRNQPGYSTNAYGLATNAANSATGAGQGMVAAGQGIGNMAGQQGQLALGYGNLGLGFGQLANSNAGVGLNAINAGLSAGAGLTNQGAGFFQGATSSASAPFSWINANTGMAQNGLTSGANSMYQGMGLQMQGLGSILDSKTSVYNSYEDPMMAVLGMGAQIGAGWLAGR